jgi:hypothetical protein
MTSGVLDEQFLKRALCELTEVTRTSQGYEVTLPQAYATGNIVSVTVSRTTEGYIVHDNSYAAMALQRTGTPKLQQMVEGARDAIKYYGCELVEMRVTRRCTSLDEVALAMVLVGCGSRLIADQALSTDRMPMFDFRAQLLGRVTGIVGEDRVRTNTPVTGHLGSKYRIAATVITADGRKPMAFIEPLSDPQALSRKFKEFYDIGQNSDYADVERVAVLDDSKSFPTGDTLLMQEVSTLVRYSDSATLFAQWGTVQ